MRLSETAEEGGSAMTGLNTKCPLHHNEHPAFLCPEILYEDTEMPFNGDMSSDAMRAVTQGVELLREIQDRDEEIDRLRRKLIAARLESVEVMVREFHEAFKVRLGESWDSPPRRELRRRLIREEFEEYEAAEADGDPVATLDALVDLTYVIVGAALEYGFDFTGAFQAVHQANMAKLGPDGRPILRLDGKVTKPEGWHPADLSPFVKRR